MSVPPFSPPPSLSPLRNNSNSVEIPKTSPGGRDRVSVNSVFSTTAFQENTWVSRVPPKVPGSVQFIMPKRTVSILRINLEKCWPNDEFDDTVDLREEKAPLGRIHQIAINLERVIPKDTGVQELNNYCLGKMASKEKSFGGEKELSDSDDDFTIFDIED